MRPKEVYKFMDSFQLIFFANSKSSRGLRPFYRELSDKTTTRARGALMKRYLFCFVTLLLLGLTSNTFAQDVTARVDGLFTEPAGAVVTKATITLTNTKTGEVRTVESNDDGGYTQIGRAHVRTTLTLTYL